MVDLRRGMGLGADDYLTKPFMIKDLLTAVKSRLKRHQLTPAPYTPSDYLTTIQGHDEKGTMILLAADCLLFYVVNRQCFVRHPLGTLQINRSLDTLAAELDPTQFFPANRQVLLHRQTVRNTHTGIKASIAYTWIWSVKASKLPWPEPGLSSLSTG
ncbi:hypothetical protein [Spirosoma koreense]